MPDLFPKPLSRARKQYLMNVLAILDGWGRGDDIEVTDTQLLQDASWLWLIGKAPETMVRLLRGGFRLRPQESPQAVPDPPTPPQVLERLPEPSTAAVQQDDVCRCGILYQPGSCTLKGHDKDWLED